MSESRCRRNPRLRGDTHLTSMVNKIAKVRLGTC